MITRNIDIDINIDRNIDIDIIIVINAQLRHKNNLGFSGLVLQDNLGLFLEPEWQH